VNTGIGNWKLEIWLSCFYTVSDDRIICLRCFEPLVLLAQISTFQFQAVNGYHLSPLLPIHFCVTRQQFWLGMGKNKLSIALPVKISATILYFCKYSVTVIHCALELPSVHCRISGLPFAGFLSAGPDCTASSGLQWVSFKTRKKVTASRQDITGSANIYILF